MDSASAAMRSLVDEELALLYIIYTVAYTAKQTLFILLTWLWGSLGIVLIALTTREQPADCLMRDL